MCTTFHSGILLGTDQFSVLGNEQVAFNVTANLGSPDGMTIDSEGKLWVACFKGGKVSE